MSRLTAQIPDNNIEERKHIISALFADFLLAEPPLIQVSDTDCTTLTCDGKSILFRDHLWNAHPKPLSYLDIRNLPSPTTCTNPFALEKDIVVLFGNDELTITDNAITCGIDIWASAFFMLTRWEEYVNPTRDEHGRFPAAESTALKHNFLHRPVVNEYAEMLRRMMEHLNFDIAPKKARFRPILTHDIDILQSNPKWKSIAGDVLKRHDLRLALSRLAEPHNVYDTFNFLMDQSEKAGTRSIFFFMAADHRLGHSCNYLNTRKFAQTTKEIKQRGHIIGFHAGHGTADNPQQYADELQLLRNRTGLNITFSRQHFLKFDMPHTFNILEDNGISHDFSLGYSQCDGFRCGTGNSYRVFDFLNRKTLNLREVPLITMDGTLKNNKQLSPAQAEEQIHNTLKICTKNRTPFSLLFHNSSFDNYTWQGWKQLYINIINQICQQP